MSPDFINQALQSIRQKDFVKARECVRAYATDHALELQHYLIHGLSSLALKDWPDAIKVFDEAATYFPYHTQILLNLGTALENAGELDRAASCYETCLELKSNEAEAAGNLSTIYRQRGRFAEAEALAHRAYELGAPKGDALNILALAVAKQGRFDEATRILSDARQQDPANAFIVANQANCAVDQLKFEEAWLFFAAARAIDDHPIFRYHEAMARLLNGDFVRGWPLYEARLELPRSLRVHPTSCLWKGEPLAGKSLVLVAEQGFGDTIQFCRYGKILATYGAELIWVVRKPLQRLLAANVPGHVVTEDDVLPATDYWLPLMSLPLALGIIRPGDAPAAPYLHVPDAVAPFTLPADKRRIGLVWRGSPAHERDHERSIPLEEFTPLFEKVSAHYYAPARAVRDEPLSKSSIFKTLPRALDDFADTAALIAALDCVITVDTATAHLAGALGIKTFLLLPFCPDWRWGATGDTTAWYGSITILRQPRYGDWSSVIQKLMAQRYVDEPT
jgi:Flp pilus assembly protein TadD